jgi:hypothetical protein
MQVLRVTMAWCWGGCETEGSRGALRPLEERGLHRDWRATSKKWALVQKSPPDLCALDGDERAGNDAERVDWADERECRLQLTGGSSVAGDSCVLMLYPPWQPQTDGSPNRKLSRVPPAQRVRRQAQGHVEHANPPSWLLQAGTYLPSFRKAAFYCVSTVSLLA